MNKNNTCALFVLSLTSIATLSLIPTRSATAAEAYKQHRSTLSNQLPALAVAPPARVASSSSMHLSTIPLIPGIGQSGGRVAADSDVPSSSSTSTDVQTISKTMNVGESEIFEFDKISTTAVGDPTVADIAPLSSSRLLVSAKGVGHTTIFVYDRHGRSSITVTVLPSENMSVIASKIEEEIGIPTVTVRAINDTIFLEGAAPTPSASALAEAIAKAYSTKVINLISVGVVQPQSEAERYSDLLNENLSTAGITAQAFDDKTIILKGKYARPTGHAATSNEMGVTDDSPANQKAVEADPLDVLLKSLPADLRIINLINFERQEQRQILVRAKIVDIDRTSTKTLGLDWGTSNFTATQVGTSATTQIVDQFQSQPILFTQAPGSLFNNLLGGGGPLARYQPFAAQLNALIHENKARVLSQPSLMVLDGNEASMLVGGEFPVPMVQGASGGGAVTVQFKPFGIRLNVAPIVVSDDTIQLTVTPEVSEIDFSDAVQSNGISIPGISIRRATSTLQMKNGQTLVIGGLYSNNYGKTINKIPFLGNIPILGEFFKSTSTNKTERELLVMIETEIVTPSTLGATPPPADSLENLDIQKPFVPRKEFDQDSPDLQNGPFHKDHEAPKVPVEMPGTGK